MPILQKNSAQLDFALLCAVFPVFRFCLLVADKVTLELCPGAFFIGVRLFAGVRQKLRQAFVFINIFGTVVKSFIDIKRSVL